MTNESDPSGTAPKSAKEIRSLMAEKELEEAKRAQERLARAEKEAAEFKDYFMSSEVTDEDRQRIGAKIDEGGLVNWESQRVERPESTNCGKRSANLWGSSSKRAS